MRHYSLLLAATLAIAGLSAGCESWNNDKTPDLDNGSTDQSQSDMNNAGTSDQTSNHDADRTNSADSTDTGATGTSGSK